jgi:hypothetical protein
MYVAEMVTDARKVEQFFAKWYAHFARIKAVVGESHALVRELEDLEKKVVRIGMIGYQTSHAYEAAKMRSRFYEVVAARLFMRVMLVVMKKEEPAFALIDGRLRATASAMGCADYTFSFWEDDACDTPMGTAYPDLYAEDGEVGTYVMGGDETAAMWVWRMDEMRH